MKERGSKLTLKERQREEREHFILHEAEKVLIEKGYYNTSMDEIATRVGVAKGTLYLHFKTKDELVFSIVEPKLQSFFSDSRRSKVFPGDK